MTAMQIIDVGWMTTFALQIERRVISSMEYFRHSGMYRYFDLPDLAP
jgi:hypothetical protein